MDGSKLPPAGPWGPREPLAPQNPPPVPPVEPSRQPVAFISQGKAFLKLLARGAALTLVTFGFYRFWLATDIRRHLWSHTLVDGENAEYTGTGRELLIGFLFALAILAPIYLAYFLIGLEAERYQAFASIPLALFMFLFGSFAQYRARRYRLTRTVWRGVRFWMQGSGWKYAFLSFGWSLLVALTLGAAYPWRQAALERYKMRHTYYGDQQGAFEATGFQLFRKGVWMWLYALAVLALIVAGAIAWADSKSSLKSGGEAMLVLGIIGLIPLPFMYPYLKAIEWRWWASGVGLGATRLESQLRGGQLLGLFFKYLVIVSLVTSGIMTLVLGFGMAIAEVIGLKLENFNPKELSDLKDIGVIVLIAGGALGYLIVILAAGVVQRFFMQHEYWRTIAGSLTVIKAEAMEEVAAKGDLAHALGEGLADGLDVAGF